MARKLNIQDSMAGTITLTGQILVAQVNFKQLLINGIKFTEVDLTNVLISTFFASIVVSYMYMYTDYNGVIR